MDEKICSSNENTEKVVCKNCGSIEVEDGYEICLCKNCRDLLSKRSTPLWIKIISIIILLIVIFALLHFPPALKAGIEFERGVNAEEETKYITAREYYKKAAEYYADSTPVLARLFITYCYTQKPNEAAEVLKLIEDRKTSDDKIIHYINEGIKYLNSLYNISPELADILEQDDTLEEMVSKLQTYTEENPSDPLGFVNLGNTLFDMAMFDMASYSEAYDAYEKAAGLDPNLYIVKLDMAAACRQLGQLDKAEELCREVLKVNAENPTAFSALSKIELKRKNYDKALKLAERAYELDMDNLSIVENLCIVYHYKGMTAGRDRMFDILEENNYYRLEIVQLILDGTLKIYE